MSIYLTRFVLPINRESDLIEQRMYENGREYGYIDNIYPCQIFNRNSFSEVNFDTVTIFYGGNGSGKSTLLNLISSRLELNRISPFNSSELFDIYTNNCKYELGYDEEGFKYRIPNGSRIITSDDIFDYMLTIRSANLDTAECIEQTKDVWHTLRYGPMEYDNILDHYEEFRTQMLARNRNVSRRQFIRRTVGQEVKLNSNGETALEYFNQKLKNDTLYCLDEPENSLSPKMQIKLVEMLESMARFCGCQFIIATHSPFILAMNNARIYDLDENPVDIKKWWELENTQQYFEFFYKHKDLFLVE